MRKTFLSKGTQVPLSVKGINEEKYLKTLEDYAHHTKHQLTNLNRQPDGWFHSARFHWHVFNQRSYPRQVTSPDF